LETSNQVIVMKLSLRAENILEKINSNTKLEDLRKNCQGNQEGS
jgi:hypothetical protein